MATMPEKVEVGQVWADRDRRSAGAGEFVVLHLTTDIRHRLVARVRRFAGDRHTTIRVSRLLAGRAYEYLGKSR